MISVSTWFAELLDAFHRLLHPLLPSNSKGLVTAPTVSADLLGDLGNDRRRAGARAAVSPAVTKTMSAPLQGFDLVTGFGRRTGADLEADRRH